MNPQLMMAAPGGMPPMPGMAPEEGLELPLLIQLLQDRLAQQAGMGMMPPGLGATPPPGPAGPPPLAGALNPPQPGM